MENKEKECKIRWVCNACFEIALPSGKTILVDPYIDECKTKPFDSGQVEGADYILISHIHFDHVMDVHNLWKRFDSKVFVGDLSAEELCRIQNIPAGCIYRIRGGERYQFDDVTIEVMRARHTEWKQGVYVNSIEGANAGRPKKEERSMWLGFLEMYNFKITASDGTVIVIWGGMPTEDQVHMFADARPDIAAMHVSPNQDMDLFLRLCGAMKPHVVIPHHYDLSELLLKENPQLLQRENAMSPRQLIAYLKDEMPRRCTNGEFKELEHGAWYRASKKLQKI